MTAHRNQCGKLVKRGQTRSVGVVSSKVATSTESQNVLSSVLSCASPRCLAMSRLYRERFRKHGAFVPIATTNLLRSIASCLQLR